MRSPRNPVRFSPRLEHIHFGFDTVKCASYIAPRYLRLSTNYHSMKSELWGEVLKVTTVNLFFQADERAVLLLILPVKGFCPQKTLYERFVDDIRDWQPEPHVIDLLESLRNVEAQTQSSMPICIVPP